MAGILEHTEKKEETRSHYNAAIHRQYMCSFLAFILFDMPMCT